MSFNPELENENTTSRGLLEKDSIYGKVHYKEPAQKNVTVKRQKKKLKK